MLNLLCTLHKLHCNVTRPASFINTFVFGDQLKYSFCSSQTGVTKSLQSIGLVIFSLQCNIITAHLCVYLYIHVYYILYRFFKKNFIFKKNSPIFKKFFIFSYLSVGLRNKLYFSMISPCN